MRERKRRIIAVTLSARSFIVSIPAPSFAGPSTRFADRAEHAAVPCAVPREPEDEAVVFSRRPEGAGLERPEGEYVRCAAAEEERRPPRTLRAGAKDSRDYFFFAAGFAAFFAAFFAAGTFAAAFASTFFATGAPSLSGFEYDVLFFREYARKNGRDRRTLR